MPFEPDPKVADAILRMSAAAFEDDVWKHTIGSQPPSAANYRGARWNPAGIPAIYVATHRDTALAEGDHLVALQPQPIVATRTLHRAHVALARVVDLRERAALRSVGLSDSDLRSNDHAACRVVGGTAEWTGVDGLLVPSARHRGGNLVIFERRVGPGFELMVLETELLAAHQ